jgi:DNA-binding SARP family transcriptional activator
VKFNVLGPIEVRDEGGPIALAGTKPRKLLARLLVDANSVVSVDALTDALWTSGEAPPVNGASTIQVYVSNLRRALGPPVIRTVAPGYALDLDGHTCDAHQLAELVAASRSLRTEGHLDGAIAAARSAISLPRGEPYADFAYEDWAQAAVREINETVLSAHEELHAALLAADLDDEAIPRLEGFGAQHPYRERTRGQLMLALYRTGRQADALRTYAEGREAMVDALGVEPGSELQQLATRILEQDPALLTTTRRYVRPPVPIVRVESTMVGRLREQRTISSAISRADQGELQVVLVDGPAGIGKSALGHWASDHAAAREMRTATGRAHDLDGAPPFWPWSQPLRTLDLADAFEPAGDSPFLLYASLCERLAAATRDQPMVAVLDDMHWADRGSIDFLKFLARAPTSARLTIVAMYRSVPPDHPLALLAADLSTERRVTRLLLEPLSDAETSRLVDHLTGGRVNGHVAGSIARRTGGNPFFVEELVRLMDTGDGELDVDAAAVPRTVAELLRRRAEALSANAVAVLTSAAFLAGPFSAELPAAVTEQPEHSVRTVFDAAVADGILVDEPGRVGWWAFAHDLIRHAFYDPVPPLARAEMHLSIGEVMVASLGDQARSAAPELATHFARAAGVGGAERAVHWARVASDRAIEALAYEDAVRHLRRALFVTRRELRDRPLECDVLLDLAGAARLAADQPTAARAAQRAEQIARTLDDPIRRERARTPMFRGRVSAKETVGNIRGETDM